MAIKHLQSLKSKKGFTLVELIVVIAIIAVLAAILIPILLNWVTQSSISSAKGDAKSVYNAITAAITQNDADGNEAIEGTPSTLPGSETFTAANFPTIIPEHISSVPSGTTTVWFNDNAAIVAVRVARPGAADLPDWSGSAWTGTTEPGRGNIFGIYPDPNTST
jgi:prepilin-type N-terminal cleavage/methylation domain-containing protein